MGWLAPGASALLIVAAVVQLILLLIASWTDLSGRLIPDSACLGLALAGAVARLLAGPLALAESLAIAASLFFLLLLLHARGALGGGDVKLLAAVTLGQSLAGAVDVITVTALAGGVLALVHLAMRRLPRPALPPAGSSVLRRIYAAERWRILRGAPLPYGIAIACGGIWAVLTNPGVR